MSKTRFYGQYYLVGKHEDGRHITMARKSDDAIFHANPSEMEKFICEGVCDSLVLCDDFDADKYVLQFESCNGALTYYTGFNLMFRKCVGLSTQMSDSKVFSSIEKANNKAHKFAKQHGYYAIHILKV